MTRSLKTSLRNSPLRPLYLGLANTYRKARRLFIYPATAHVGVVDYDVYWDNKAQAGLGILSPWRRKRAQAFATVVSKGSSVLDLGVGDGALLQYLIEKRGVDGYGLDVSPKAVEFCRQEGLKVDLADINQPITNFIANPFDYIILSEIIEHLPDPESLLNTLRPYARKAIIVSIPNTGYHQHRLRLLMGRFPLQWVVTPGEHLRFWTLTDFRWWAQQMNFKVAQEIPYEGTRWLKAVWPGLFAAAFVYVLVDVSKKNT
ncbi:MAG: methyltransferase domain-containing protein [Anaerolineaceae bacterium]|nr:methyltransferase domain-containing protein [Anaerolineaceae bacterium]